MARRIGLLTLEEDLSPGYWLNASLRPWGSGIAPVVTSGVPDGYEAYGRLFHPAYRYQPDNTRKPVRWAEVASANGRVTHPAMEWASMTGSLEYLQNANQPGIWDQRPERGSLPLPEAARLADILGQHTATPERCWFAVWEGFAALALPRDETVPMLPIPQRNMLLLSGPLSGITTSMCEDGWDQRASLWWPDDRAWCVATDVDLMATYIGGNRACITELIHDRELEVLEVGPDQRVDWESDTINPLPPRQAG